MKKVKVPSEDILHRIKHLMRIDGASVVWSENASIKKRGEVCGTVNQNGYVIISVNGQKLTGHRVSYFLTNGIWPMEIIDHIDGDKTNNAPKNLRLVSHLENCRNKRVNNNPTGFQGVYMKRDKNHKKPYKAQITIARNSKYLGCFATPEEAHEAYKKASLEIFKEHSPYAATELQA